MRTINILVYATKLFALHSHIHPHYSHSLSVSLSLPSLSCPHAITQHIVQVEGTLSVQPQANPVVGFEEHFLGLTVENNRRNPWFVGE